MACVAFANVSVCVQVCVSWKRPESTGHRFSVSVILHLYLFGWQCHYHQITSKYLGLGVYDFRGQSREELEMPECHQLSMILRIWSLKTFLLFLHPLRQ